MDRENWISLCGFIIDISQLRKEHARRKQGEGIMPWDAGAKAITMGGLFPKNRKRTIVLF